VIDSLVPASSRSAIRDELERLVADAPLGDNEFDGRATRRVFDPLARTRVLDDWVCHPLLTASVEAVIGPFQFGMTILSQVLPREVTQRLHRDSSVYPLPADFGPVQVNTIWAIDEFTPANGATLVAPGSHLEGRPQPARDSIPLVAAVMGAGSVLVYDGRLLHGAGGNDTESGRIGLIIEHTVRWLRPAENHPLAVPPAIVATLSTRLQEALGYNRQSSYLGFVAGRDPLEWLRTRADRADRDRIT
jgi:ectoine hydroxylase-related dioxygenase (phytanoyl-CoA dioxygenase family)